MKPFELPQSLNYIGVFLTFGCNLNCSYCINDPEQKGDRKTIFTCKRKAIRELRPDEWGKALSRIPKREDLPVTFQGGEPTLYWQGRGLGLILSQIDAYADLLTNFALQPGVFAIRLKGQQAKFQRPAPYPRIRVSLHIKEMDRTWGNGLDELLRRCEGLREFGFQVEHDPKASDVGIYVVDHPENSLSEEDLQEARKRVPVLLKDFLGTYNGKLYGSYAYPYSTNIRTVHHTTLKADCRTTEFLIDPLGFVWPCHLFMYQSWLTEKPAAWFSKMQDFSFKSIERYYEKGMMFPIGHVLDPDFEVSAIETYRPCFYYGQCLECDTKLKRDRFGSENIYRSSVIIKNIQWPKELESKVSNDHKRIT